MKALTHKNLYTNLPPTSDFHTIAQKFVPYPHMWLIKDEKARSFRIDPISHVVCY